MYLIIVKKSFFISIISIITCILTGCSDSNTKSSKLETFPPETYTNGLVFKLINSDTEYQVSQGSTIHNSSIVIPDYWNGKKVTSIGRFDKCYNLKRIVISSNTKSIEDYAFSSCTNLTKITIPPKVRYIGECAFYKSGIRMIEMKPKKSPELGLYCFQYTDLKKITTPVIATGYDNYPWNALSEI